MFCQSKKESEKNENYVNANCFHQSLALIIKAQKMSYENLREREGTHITYLVKKKLKRLTIVALIIHICIALTRILSKRFHNQLIFEN